MHVAKYIALQNILGRLADERSPYANLHIG